MGDFSSFEEVKGSGNKIESLSINSSKGKVRAILNSYYYIDKDTNQYMYVIPSIDVSGYGDTKEEAKKMLQFSVDNFCSYIIKLPKSKIEEILSANGWKHNRISTKKYSKSYIDIEGKLQDFNAVDNKIQQEVLTF